MDEIKEPKEPTFSEKKNEEAPVKVIREEEFPENRQIVEVKTFSKPLVSVNDAKQAFKDYQGLINALVTEKDITKIGTKLVAKKSGINKLARFFGISVEVIKEKQETFKGTDSKGKIITIFVAKVWAKAILPNGQFRVAGAACSSSERAFNHVYADVFATAETRAKKRAIEELIGFGELELEEDQSR